MSELETAKESFRHNTSVMPFRRSASAKVLPYEDRHDVIVSNSFAGDMSFHEMAEFVKKTDWFVEASESNPQGLGFEKRIGFGFMGGGMLGVTTILAHVTDKLGRQVGESMGTREGEPLARFLDTKYPKLAPHHAETVWDADHAAAVTSHFMGSTISVDAEGKKAAYAIAGGKLDDDGNMKLDKDGKIPAAPEHTLRPEKKKLLGHVSDALGAMVRALEYADGEKGGHTFYITDYFGLREKAAQIQRDNKAKGQEGVSAKITSEDLKKADKILDLEPPIMMLKRVCKTLDELCLVVPYPEDAELEEEETLKTWKSLYPSRTLVLVPISGKFKITTSFNLLAAICNACATGKAVPETGLAESPRPCLVGVASGGFGVLEQMAELSTDKHSVRLIVLHGSGRLADLWAEVWPRRGEETFDPTVASLRLQKAACFPPNVNHVECMRQVLNNGEVIMHPITNQSSTLERLCIGLMLGDKLLQLAKAQQAAYTAARHRYNMPRLILRNASIGLGLVSTIVAISVPDGGSYGIAEDGTIGEGGEGVSMDNVASQPLWVRAVYYASIILPAVMLVVDQIEAYLGTSKALNACERAAGLVESQTFRYKTKAGIYSDKNLAEMAGHQATDFATARQLLLAKKLNAIQLEVAASDAQVDIKAGTETMSGAMMEHVLLMKHAAKGTAAADELDGDEYLKLRVEPMVIASTRASCMLLFWSLVGRIFLFVASAVGSVFATIGWSRYVAISVAFSTSVSRWLAATRVEERRTAHMKAASELNCAKLKWEALPGEQRTTQRVLDQLVCEAERFLESTLPPANKSWDKQRQGGDGSDDGSGAQLHAAARAAVLMEGSYAAGADREAQMEKEADLIESLVRSEVDKQTPRS